MAGPWGLGVIHLLASLRAPQKMYSRTKGAWGRVTNRPGQVAQPRCEQEPSLCSSHILQHRSQAKVRDIAEARTADPASSEKISPECLFGGISALFVVFLAPALISVSQSCLHLSSHDAAIQRMGWVSLNTDSPGLLTLFYCWTQLALGSLGPTQHQLSLFPMLSSLFH